MEERFWAVFPPVLPKLAAPPDVVVIVAVVVLLYSYELELPNALEESTAGIFVCSIALYMSLPVYRHCISMRIHIASAIACMWIALQRVRADEFMYKEQRANFNGLSSRAFYFFYIYLRLKKYVLLSMWLAYTRRSRISTELVFI